MSIDVSIYSDYRRAKSEAGKLAVSMRFELGQTPTGKPQVRTTTGRLKPFRTWLAAYTWLYAVWRDRQPKAEIPWAIVLE